MNEVINNIINRRSTRGFTEENIDENLIKEIIKSGLYAPSSKNKQLWHFTVIENKEVLNDLDLKTKNAVKKYASEYIKNEDILKMLNNKANNDAYNTFYNAPVAIIISRDTRDETSQDDCATASQNIMLASESLGLGSCWIGFIKFLFMLDKEEGKKYMVKFNIPKNYIPTHAIIIGHKKTGSAKASERRENTVTYIK